jgi:hypothetical protein
MLLAGAACWQVAGWPQHVASATYRLGALSVPRLDTDLVLEGLGLGLVIAPVTAAALRAASPPQHGLAAAAVVVARMLGMLIGVAALTAWGLHRFNQLTAGLVPPLPFGMDPAEFRHAVAEYQRQVSAALRLEYRQIFLAAAASCGAGVVTCLGLRAGARGSTSRPGADQPPGRLSGSGRTP